ncbi:MAG: hypothetical protein QOF69_3515 [Solirubrobacteraceae bacterium]|jgi:hypothetical protein|nr:hypothetical protein [Solirubrobacteraceae bacterium]MEA2184330.1 hypothetical protein [Solirubrobacteraceae bacterium]
MRNYRAGLVAAAGVAAFVVSASASGSTSRTIALVHDQTSFSAPDNPSRAPAGGDRFAFTNDDFAGHKKVGRDQISCMAVSGSSAQCSASFLLHRGVIEAAGALPLNKNPKVVVLAITGGTGRFAGARGFIRSTELTQTRSALTIHLL